MDGLLDQEELSDAEQDYLDVLSDQIEAYEAEAVPIRPVGDADMLRFLIESRGATQAAVAAEAGIAESTTPKSWPASGRSTGRKLASWPGISTLSRGCSRSGNEGVTGEAGPLDQSVVVDDHQDW